MAAQHHDVVIVGGGLAWHRHRARSPARGQSVALVNADAPERLGGLALWAFGGMAGGHGAAGTHEDPDSPGAPRCATGCGFGEIPGRHLSAAVGALLRRAFARRGVRLASGRGRQIHACGQLDRARAAWRGNSVPRYHIIWGTARELAPHDRRDAPGRHGRAAHRAAPPPRQCAGFAARPHVRRAGVNEDTGAEVRLTAAVVVLAMGGINGGHAQTRANWPTNRPCPPPCSTAHPLPTGDAPHAADRWGAQITTQARDVNYAAGFPHPFRISRGMACPPFRASRRCGSTTGANASDRNRWSPVSTPTGCASKWPRKRSPGPGTC